MADLKDKPNAFTEGQESLSAGDLNKVRDATPRLITGGSGVHTIKFGDRIIISSRKKDKTNVTTAIMTVAEEHEDFIVCYYDGGYVPVAKQWRDRGSTGQYDIDGGEEVLAVRVPSARIAGSSGELITWVVVGGRGAIPEPAPARWRAYEGP